MIELECSNGFLLFIDGENLVIQTKRTEECIPISAIQSLTVREPHGLTRFGTFTFRVAQAPTSSVRLGFGITAALGAERNFFYKDWDDANELAEYISGYEERKRLEQVQTQNTLSVSDEIRKLKALVDEGIITQDEFEAKKKQLLGI